MGKERRQAGTLSLPNRLVNLSLASIEFDGAIVNETTRWGNALMRSRDAWADANRNGKRYSDRDQDHNRLPERPARRW